VRNLITGELKDHVLAVFFDEDATEITIDRTPTPDTNHRMATTANVVKARLAP
jgi:hypothetical protein